jgi:uncharacterized membrane protein YeiH
MEYMLFLIDMIGTVAFAFSGAMTAIRKEMDILGVMILGMITAVGGGIIRDMILGTLPPQAFQEPVFALSGVLVSAFVFAIFYFHVKGYRQISGLWFQQALMLADTLGLGVFTVVGVRAAFDNGMGINYFLPVFLGTITGVGGGLLRDIMAGDRPYIFVKHVYASASIVGAVVCVFCWNRIGDWGSQCGCAKAFGNQIPMESAEDWRREGFWRITPVWR